MRKPYAMMTVLPAAMLALSLSAPASAQELDVKQDRGGRIGIGVGFGPMLGTDEGTMMGLTMFGEYYMTDNVSFGPLLQLGFDDDYQLGLSGQAKYTFSLAGNKAVHPHVQSGIGFIHESHRNSDTDYLIPIGVGIDVDISKNLTMGTTVLINVTGVEDSAFVNWFFGFKLMLF